MAVTIVSSHHATHERWPGWVGTSGYTQNGSPAYVSLITGSMLSNFIGLDHRLPPSQADTLKNQTREITNACVRTGNCYCRNIATPLQNATNPIPQWIIIRSIAGRSKQASSVRTAGNFKQHESKCNQTVHVMNTASCCHMARVNQQRKVNSGSRSWNVDMITWLNSGNGVQRRNITGCVGHITYDLQRHMNQTQNHHYRNLTNTQRSTLQVYNTLQVPHIWSGNKLSCQVNSTKINEYRWQ